MRRANYVVFEDFLYGTTPVQTGQAFNARLGQFDQLGIMAVADGVTGTSPTLAVQIQTSADGRNWVNKNTTAEVPAFALVTTQANVGVGSDAGTQPALGYNRLNITLGGTTPGAHVKIWVTQRDAS